MQSLSVEPPWIVPAALVFFNFLAWLVIRRNDKRHVRQNRGFQLLMFDAAFLYVYISLNRVAPGQVPEALWPWLVFFSLSLLVLPFILYWVWLRVVSLFLLPVDLKHWRQWSLPARAMVSFVRGRNHPYFGYNEESGELEKRLGGRIMLKNQAGIITVQPEHAVVLHSGSKLTRVEGGDIIFTGRREQALQLLDLRPHIMVAPGVHSVTKDGIGVTLTIFVPCRIDPQGAAQQPERLYPFNAATVFKVVCQQQGVDDKQSDTWQVLVRQRAEKTARDIIATYVLDRLYEAEDPSQIARDELVARMRNRLQAEMVGTGIEILGLGIGNIEPVELAVKPKRAGSENKPAGEEASVSGQRVASWQAAWRRRDQEREARGKAEAIRIMEEARARALTELINKVDEAFREMSEAGGVTQAGDVVALSFINAIEQMLSNQDLPEPLDIALPETRFPSIQGIRSRLILSSGA